MIPSKKAPLLRFRNSKLLRPKKLKIHRPCPENNLAAGMAKPNEKKKPPSCAVGKNNQRFRFCHCRGSDPVTKYFKDALPAPDGSAALVASFVRFFCRRPVAFPSENIRFRPSESPDRNRVQPFVRFGHDSCNGRPIKRSPPTVRLSLFFRLWEDCLDADRRRRGKNESTAVARVQRGRK